MVFRSGNSFFVALLAALVLTPGASAWAWPVDGPVLRPFVSDGDPYAGGQHRGIDIGAPTASDVRSAANGVVAFAGRMPRQGLCLTVRTTDGWSVTLVHLGSIGVPVGTQVAEGDVVGTIGPSGEPEGAEPYVHLGVRLTADPNGYVDPLTLLPPPQAPEPPPVQPPVQQPATAQAAVPPAAPRRATPSEPTPRPARTAAARREAHRSATVPRHVVTETRASTTTANTARVPRVRPRHVLLMRSAPVRSTRAHDSSSHQRPHRPRGRTRRVRSGDPVAPAPRHALRPEVVAVAAGAGGSRRLLPLAFGLAGLALVLLGLISGRRRRRAVPRPSAPSLLRKMSATEPVPEEYFPEPSTTAHFPRRRVALREWPAPSGACRRLRSSVGHHRPVSPSAGRRRTDGQRHRRARHTRHDRRRSRGSVPA
jgi:hypothetical protein